MFLRLAKLAVIKLAGLALLLVGIWIGLVVNYGEEVWLKSTIASYGGTILAWAFGGTGFALLAYNGAPAPKREEPEP